MTNSLREWMRTWARGRALTRGTVQPVDTAYGCVVPSYADSPVMRHIVVGDEAVVRLAHHAERPLGLSIVGNYEEWEDKLPKDLKSFGEPMSLMLGPLSPTCLQVPRGYTVVVEHTHEKCTARALLDDAVVSQVHGGIASRSDASSQHVVVFDQVSTTPEHQRKGLGKLLMSKVNEWGQSEGAEAALLSASPMGALLYQALGFQTLAPMAAWESVAPTMSPDSALAIHTKRLQDIAGGTVSL